MIVDGITLAAKPRRLAIYYAQMAAFQAKTEMGLDLGDVLSTQAVAELQYKQFCTYGGKPSSANFANSRETLTYGA